MNVATGELDLDAAFARLGEALEPLTAVEDVPLLAARGRILARAVQAPLDLPSQDVAAMDGYAVRSADMAQGPRTLPVIAQVLAGHPLAHALAPGTCARIMTGAPLPEGCDAVVVWEVAQAAADDRVLLPGPVAAGANRRARGEHLRRGETVLGAGRRLHSPELALAAALGSATLPVLRALRVGVLSTGDELRDGPAPLEPGAAYDSNRPMLLASLAQAAMVPVDMGICIDDPAALAQAIDRAFEHELDAMLISGGAALGDADIVRSMGGVSFVPVNVRPGRGIAWARLRRGTHRLLLLGLPGNAVAAYVLAHLLALPLLARMAGATAAAPPQPLHLPLAVDLQTRAGRIDFRRARLVAGPQGRRLVEPLPAQGSAMIRSVCEAQALVAVGPQAQYRAGELVPAYLLCAFESPDRG